MNTYQVSISEKTLQDIINIETGLLYPLRGFMAEDDFRCVVNTYVLGNKKDVFPIPITLDVGKEVYDSVREGDKLRLIYKQQFVAEQEVTGKFETTDEDWKKVFTTLDMSHPGVNNERSRFPYRVGGITKLIDCSLLENALRPEKTKEVFREKGWNTVVGFQTRNPIHKAHEHIQRIGLEICDGLFINPLIGWKKKGDFTQEAVVAAYTRMIEEFYPKGRVYMAGLKTQMRYAGPREAVFHAIIRRNLGCTHFIIGRDHAGVGGFYGAYDAHKLAKELSQQYDLGIQMILTREPYYCNKCRQIVTDKSCAHYDTHRTEISGTIIRKYISDGKMPDDTMLRNEIFKAILACKEIFIQE